MKQYIDLAILKHLLKTEIGSMSLCCTIHIYGTGKDDDCYYAQGKCFRAIDKVFAKFE